MTRKRRSRVAWGYIECRVSSAVGGIGDGVGTLFAMNKLSSPTKTMSRATRDEIGFFEAKIEFFRIESNILRGQIEFSRM